MPNVSVTLDQPIIRNEVKDFGAIWKAQPTGTSSLGKTNRNQ